MYSLIYKVAVHIEICTYIHTAIYKHTLTHINIYTRILGTSVYIDKRKT